MDNEMLNKIVPVKLFGIEKKNMREDRTFLNGQQDGPSYAINLLYENEFDPADGTHKFSLLPENPNFLKIKKWCETTQLPVEDMDLNLLSDSLHDMYGCWYILDMSATPVCRVYTEDLCKIQDGKVVVVHKKGEPMHKKDPSGNDTNELAAITQLPVWGFCRKTPDGRWVWMKGNDPKVRVEREINQGRLIYINTPKPAAEVALTPDKKDESAEKSAEASDEEKKPKIAGDASEIVGEGIS